MDERLLALVAKYDRPGPRYTSYPTAPEWRDDFGPGDYAAALADAAARPDAPLALYVHVPFCEERCTFCGCNVVVTRRRDTADGYPGIPGLGPKTAARLIATHGHLEDFPHELFGVNRDAALLFEELATLRTDAPLFKNVDELRWTGATPAFAAIACTS